MGVPSFFKWLAKRYPKTVVGAVEAKTDASSDGDAATDAAFATAAAGAGIPPPLGGNPLVDNLYLDMNGIIHPCCHPEEGGSYTEEEMLRRIWAYVQRIVSMVRPQRLVYMAIDGVAPRAKMNQQRSRRFRAAREAAQKQEVRMKLAAEWRARGFTLPPEFEHASKEEWDSNVITPGTPFMAKVSAALHYHIEHALQFDPAWRHLTIIFSDATVPGEGEHKIINWIREQRTDPAYDPNTRHVLYGMDADLIMLGLATHERYFYIIREALGDTTSSAHVKCSICGERGHYNDQCKGDKWKTKTPDATDASPDAQMSPSPASSPDPLIPQSIASVVAFQFLHLPILREYLTRELSLPPAVMQSLPFAYDFENMLDDFLLLCMFVGNDFLPHLPSLEIREGAIEMLLKIYKELLPTLGGYLAHQGIVNLDRLCTLMTRVGAKENEIFNRRRSKEEFHRKKDREHKDRITRIRNDNAARERQLNKHGNYAYEQDGKVKEEKKETTKTTLPPITVAAVPPPPPAVDVAPVTPITSGFIHPSRQQSDPTQAMTSLARNASSQPAPPPTPTSAAPTTPTAAVPIPAPKANLSAAALLRQKLKSGKPLTTTPVETTPPAADTSSLDTSSLPVGDPAMLRQASDPIPSATAAMSTLTTAHEDGSAVQENARAASLLRQSLLGKRKEPTPKTGVAAVAPSASATTTATESSTDAMASSSPVAPDLLAPASSSPPLELPLKKTKTAESAAPQFDPLEEDQFGNLIRGQTFETYFANKWESINAPQNVEDTVQFGVDGWKKRYYQSKLKFDCDAARDDPISGDARTAHNLFKTYLEGLCWVMHYYFHGPSSWSWYFPFHYAPLAEDLAIFLQEGNLKRGVEYQLGEPFTPVAQLMAVLPSRSRHCVPAAVRPLMTSAVSSPLAAFYPDDFELDLNGAKFLWKAVALLPFIDEHLLLSELRKIEHTFNEEEQERNSRGNEYVFVHARSNVGQQMVAQVYQQQFGGGEAGLRAVRRLTTSDIQSTPSVTIDTVASRGFSGALRPYASASVPSLQSVLFSPDQPVPTRDVEVVSGIYILPPHRPHRCELLTGIDPFTPQLVEDDFFTMRERREFVPRNNRGRNGGGGGDRNAAGDGNGFVPTGQRGSEPHTRACAHVTTNNSVCVSNCVSAPALCCFPCDQPLSSPSHRWWCEPCPCRWPAPCLRWWSHDAASRRGAPDGILLRSEPAAAPRRSRPQPELLPAAAECADHLSGTADGIRTADDTSILPTATTTSRYVSTRCTDATHAGRGADADADAPARLLPAAAGTSRLWRLFAPHAAATWCADIPRCATSAGKASGMDPAAGATDGAGCTTTDGAARTAVDASTPTHSPPHSQHRLIHCHNTRIVPFSARSSSRECLHAWVARAWSVVSHRLG